MPLNFNTEDAEPLRGLCVEAFLNTEDAETLHTPGKIFAAREGGEKQWHRGHNETLSVGPNPPTDGFGPGASADSPLRDAVPNRAVASDGKLPTPDPLRAPK